GLFSLDQRPHVTAVTCSASRVSNGCVDFSLSARSFMLIRNPADIPSSAITSKDKYLNRRRFLRGAVAAGAAAVGAGRLADMINPRIGVHAGTKLDTVKSPLTTTGQELTSLEYITHYNNYYEFGVNESDPAENAGVLPARPWTPNGSGLVQEPKTFDLD